MSSYFKRQVALIAELLAGKLICTCQGEHIPVMVDGFASADFTRAALHSDPVKSFQILVIVAYDRTRWLTGRGYVSADREFRPGLYVEMGKLACEGEACE